MQYVCDCNPFSRFLFALYCRQEREAEKERKKREKYEQKKREKIQKIHCKYEMDSILFCYCSVLAPFGVFM